LDVAAIHAASVVFVPSFSEAERAFLLRNARVLVYTPANEVAACSLLPRALSHRGCNRMNACGACVCNCRAVQWPLSLYVQVPTLMFPFSLCVCNCICVCWCLCVTVHADARACVGGEQHFGIVPVEAMYARVPVVAANSGGPTESVVHGDTGFLEPPEPAAFAAALARIVHAPAAERRVRDPLRDNHAVRERESHVPVTQHSTHAYCKERWVDAYVWVPLHMRPRSAWASGAAPACRRFTRWRRLAPPWSASCSSCVPHQSRAAAAAAAGSDVIMWAHSEAVGHAAVLRQRRLVPSPTPPHLAGLR
jgi:hypothetical protein